MSEATVEPRSDEPNTDAVADASPDQPDPQTDATPPSAADISDATSPETPSEATDTTGAETPAPVAETSCSAAAFVADPDPAGLNVRSGPGSDFPVIDTLPTDGPVEVTITGSAYNWLKLTTAWSMEQQELEEAGWVYAPLLSVTTRNSNPESVDAQVPLFATPDAAATARAELPNLTEVSILTCTSDWLQVKSGEAMGWLAAENQCSSPVASCP
ncbi:MAG: SH3 domain-containing protein [Leptolyngbya sp. SIO1E4]|nr:SH3 domain-containing protein [Leptolyngbya sp. SIO1E4]